MASTARGPRSRLTFIAVLALAAALFVAACGVTTTMMKAAEGEAAEATATR